MDDNYMNKDDYNIIPADEVFVDTENDTIVTQSDLEVKPFDVIKSVAEHLGQTVKDPTPGCKHCQGRGYIGRDAETKMPIPCKCIQPNFNKDNSVEMYNRTRKLSRTERRKRDRMIIKDMKKQNKRN